MASRREGKKNPYFPGSHSCSEGVEVKVMPTFVPHEKLDAGLMEKLKSEANIFVYRIEITNLRQDWIRLLSRYWKIIDSEGEEKILTGEGVVGEKPKLYQGETFVYSSFCPLEREWGTMEGSYEMENQEGHRFQVKINRFYLVKEENHRVNFVGRSNENQ